EKMKLPWQKLNPTVSIAVVCRGGWQRIRHCLEALRRNARDEKYEVLVVDIGQNSDLDRPVKREWPHRAVLMSAPHRNRTRHLPQRDTWSAKRRCRSPGKGAAPGGGNTLDAAPHLGLAG